MKPTTLHANHRLGQPLPRQIAVVRALRGLGDLLCVVPALRALRHALPDAHVSLVGLPGARFFTERFSRYLDDLVEFPGYPGIPERELALETFPDFLTTVHRHRFDLALQMHGSGILTNPFTLLLGARLNAGFFLPDHYCPDPTRFLPYPDREPEVRRHLRLLEFLGIPLQGEELEFPVTDEDRAALAALDEMQILRGNDYICVHPGARDPRRRWAPAHFAVVADALAARGFRIVLTGTAEEIPLAAAVQRQMKSQAINLAGRTTLGALAALLSGARLLLSNDTGVSHLAAALHLPSVVLFLASDPIRWAPLDRQRHRPVGRPLKGPWGHPSLPMPEEVIAEAEGLLWREETHVA